MSRDFSDDQLMRYIDGALAPEQQARIEAALAQDSELHARVVTLRAGRRRVHAALGAAAPTGPGPDARRALARLQSAALEQTRIKETYRMTATQWKRLAAAGAALLVLGALFTLAPVRAFASDLLGIFRVEQFMLVDVSPERIEEISAAFSGQEYFGEAEALTEPSEALSAATIEEAAQLAGFTPRVPATMPTPDSIEVMGPSSMVFTPDLATMQAGFAALGIDASAIPAGIDGQPFEFHTYGAIAFAYDTEQTGLIQMPSPAMIAPDGVDPQALGALMFQVYGMSPEEAAMMASQIDWATTLVLPVPADQMDTVQEVEVDGVTGLLINQEDAYSEEAHEWESGGLALIWQKGGYLYMLMSDHESVAGLLAVANDLR